MVGSDSQPVVLYLSGERKERFFCNKFTYSHLDSGVPNAPPPQGARLPNNRAMQKEKNNQVYGCDSCSQGGVRYVALQSSHHVTNLLAFPITAPRKMLPQNGFFRYLTCRLFGFMTEIAVRD